MTSRLHRLRWIVPVAVLFVAALLRLWALSRPGTLVFDELYYVRDAVSQLAHGFPTTWPDDDPVFGGERARAFSDSPNAIAHPPLGKWLIGLGILLFGPDTGWGWRLAVAVAGVATVAVTMRLGWLMTRSLWIASLAGLLLAVDGVHVVLSRVALLDGFLTLLVALGALFVWHDQAGPVARRLCAAPYRAAARTATHRGSILWRRPWLLAAGLAFGAAAAVKWSGLYPLAAFLILITLRDWWLRRRLRTRRPFLGAATQAVVTAAITLPAAFVAYVASWMGWILNPGGQERVPGEAWWVSLVRWHVGALDWHGTLSAPHPYLAHPLSWPLALRPTAMYETSWGAESGCAWASGCVSAVSPLPNLLVTWGGVLALALLLWAVIRTLWIAARRGASSSRADTRASGRHRFGALRHGASMRSGVGALGAPTMASPAFWVCAFVLTGYLSGWLPWVLTFSRPAVFQFYAVVLTPFAALALALVLGAVAGASSTRPSGALDPGAIDVLRLGSIRLDPAPEARFGRRVAVAIFLTATLLLAAFFFPVWSGMVVPEWFWRLHLWLPGWG